MSDFQNLTTLKSREKPNATYSFGLGIKADHFTIQNTRRDMWTEAVGYVWRVVPFVFAFTIHVSVIIATDKLHTISDMFVWHILNTWHINLRFLQTLNFSN